MYEDGNLSTTELSPAVVAMWRLLDVLNNETARRQRRQLRMKYEAENAPKPPPRRKRLFLRSKSVDLPIKCYDGNNNFSVWSEISGVDDQQADPILLDDTTCCEETMTDSSAAKKRGAPVKSLEPAPVKNHEVDMGSLVEMPNCDHQGWLTDQLRGNKVWGVVSQGMLNVYETDTTSVPKYMLKLHECKVRRLEFTPKANNKKEPNGVVRHYKANNVTGAGKHQFVIENSHIKQHYVFGITSLVQLDQWIRVLNNASYTDIDSKSSEDTGISLDSSSASLESELVKLRGSSEISGKSVAPSANLRTTGDSHSLSSSFSHAQDVKKNSVVEILKRHRKDNSESEHKPQPVRATYEADDHKQHTSTENRRSRSILKNPFDNIFRRKARSSSADDALERRKHLPPEKSKVNPRLSGNFDYKKGEFKGRERKDSQGNHSSISPDVTPKSLTTNSAKSLSMSLKRTASDLRSKLFGDNEGVDFTGVKLNQLQDLRVTGFLQYRQDFKYVKVFCALCRGWLYVFKTDKPEETAMVSIRLSQCCVQYVLEPEKRKKSLFAFKLSQPQCPSVYLLADNQQLLTKWIMALQSEASNIQAGPALAEEIREKKSAQKARVANEIGMSPSDKNVLKQAELRLKRNSCPTFSPSEFGHVRGDPSRRTSDVWRFERSNQGSADKGSNSDTTVKTQRLIELSPDIYDENYTSTPFKIAELLSSDYSTATHSSDYIEDTKDTQSLRSNDFTSTKDTVTSELERVTSPQVKLTEVVTPRHNAVADAKIPCSAYSPEVKHESELLLQRASFKVKRAASLNISRTDTSTPRFASRSGVFKSRVTSFFSSAQNLLPEEGSDHQATMSTAALSCLAEASTLDAASVYRSERSFNRKPDITKPFLQTSQNMHQDEDARRNKTPSETILDSRNSNESVSESKREIISGSRPDLYGDASVVTPRNSEVGGSESRWYRFDSPVHDGALKDSWSTDESFLLAVISDRLRQRRQLSPHSAAFSPSDDSILVFNDDLPEEVINRRGKMDSEDTSDSSDSETVTSFSAFLASDRKLVAESHAQTQGFVEKRGFDEKWTRYWCVLREACLYFYLRPDDQVTVDVTELTGYGVMELIDSFPEKPFVLQFDHKNYVTVILSLDSHDDMGQWFQAIKSALTSMKRERFAQASKTANSSSVSSEENVQAMSPSTRTVKEKLLAEVLRQKQELEKMQAARNNIRKMDANAAVGTHTLTMPPDVTDDNNRICNLTRLRQRRMSAQLKLSVIKKQMDEGTGSPKERKTGFLIGRRKPDLVPIEAHGGRSDLEEQAKSLTSQLDILDNCIFAHQSSSPREADTSDNNKPILKKGPMYTSDLSLQKPTNLLYESKKDHNLYASNGDMSPRSAERDMNRGKNIKSSVQKFAHRTFSKANRYLSRKSSSPSEEKDDSKISNTSSPSNILSGMTPDVIDMTNGNSHLSTKSSALDGSDYPEPPDNFKTDYSLLTQTLPSQSKKGIFSHKASKNILLTSSYSQLDLYSPRLSPASSFPSLHLAKESSKDDNQNLNLSQLSFLKSNSPVDSLDSSGSWSPTIQTKRSTACHREVNPHAMAQIQAFEELSKRFMQDCKMIQEQ